MKKIALGFLAFGLMRGTGREEGCREITSPQPAATKYYQPASGDCPRNRIDLYFDYHMVNVISARATLGDGVVSISPISGGSTKPKYRFCGASQVPAGNQLQWRVVIQPARSTAPKVLVRRRCASGSDVIYIEPIPGG